MTVPGVNVNTATPGGARSESIDGRDQSGPDATHSALLTPEAATPHIRSEVDEERDARARAKGLTRAHSMRRASTGRRAPQRIAVDVPSAARSVGFRRSSRAAILAAMVAVGRLMFPRVIVGITEASAT